MPRGTFNDNSREKYVKMRRRLGVQLSSGIKPLHEPSFVKLNKSFLAQDLHPSSKRTGDTTTLF